MQMFYDRWRGEQPAIVFMCPSRAVSGVLYREILLGLEEEGVPVVVKEADGGAEELGFEAARLSPLEVGIGLDSGGKAVLQHRKLSRHQPLLAVSLNLRPEAARLVGLNAARLVKVLPLFAV